MADYRDIGALQSGGRDIGALQRATLVELSGTDSNAPVDTASLALTISLSGTDSNTPVDTANLTATQPFRAETLGLASGLRDFRTWAGSSDRQPIALLHVRPVRIISRWSLSSGAVYVAPVEYSYAGSARDVVSVASLDETLRRVETLAQCLATEGTYFYDIDAASASARWDDGVSQWDDGVRWDQFRGLYVHLTDDASPKNTTVLASFGVWFSTRSRIDGRPINVPTLGDDALARVAIAAPFAWTTSSNITGWDESALVSTTLAQDTAEYRGQAESAKLTISGLTTRARVSLALGGECVAGARYRFSGSYRASVGTDDHIYPAILVYDLTSAAAFLENGRDLAGANMLQLKRAAGEWRRFTFDFLVPASASVQVSFGAVSATGAAGSGEIWFEDIRLQPVFRYESPEPRLLSSSVPEVQQATTDHLFGGKTIGIGETTFANADGDPEEAFYTLSLVGGEQRLYIGGAFRNGQLLPFDNFRQSFAGIARRVTATDEEFACDLEDVRTFYHLSVPLRVFSVIDFETMDPSISGVSRPLLFGSKTNITPRRYATSPTTGYGSYEVCDVTDAPNGIAGISAVYAYASEQDARDLNTARRMLLVSGTDYTPSIATGRLTITEDVRFIEVGANNRFLDFSDGVTRQAAVAAGLYTPRTLAVALEVAMNAVSSGITVTYSNTSWRWVITKASGTLSLLAKTGAAADAGLWKDLGFGRDADLSGALQYVGPEALFKGAGTHVIRVDASGIRDDASGTYTGTPNAVIQLGPDLVRFLWVRILGLPASRIDNASFTAARTTAPYALAAWIGEPISTQEIFETIEASCMADIVIDGAGVIRFTPYTRATGTVQSLKDSDIWDWSMTQDTDDVYAELRVLHSQDPSLGTWASRYESAAAAAMQYARPDTREIKTWLASSVDAQNVATMTSRWSSSARRVATFRCSGSLLEERVGSKVRITRGRALSPDGALSARVFRITALGYDLNGDCTVSAIDDDDE